MDPFGRHRNDTGCIWAASGLRAYRTDESVLSNWLGSVRKTNLILAKIALSMFHGPSLSFGMWRAVIVDVLFPIGQACPVSVSVFRFKSARSLTGPLRTDLTLILTWSYASDSGTEHTCADRYSVGGQVS